MATPKTKIKLRHDPDRLAGKWAAFVGGRVVDSAATLPALAEKLRRMMYQSDNQKRRIVERTIENIMNAAIDISKIILASDRRPIPQSYREITQNAGLLLKLQPPIIERLASWVGLRNILAHEYLDYRWKEISDFLANGESALQPFLIAARMFLAEQRK